MDSKASSAPRHSIGELYFCNLCDKPFQKEHSRNRHIPYCRRTYRGPRIRTRACRECSAAKAKCSAQPRCSRCIRKGIECVFEDHPLSVSEQTFVTAPIPEQPDQSWVAEPYGISGGMDRRADGRAAHDPQASFDFDFNAIMENTLAKSPRISFDAQWDPLDALTYASLEQSTVLSGTTHPPNEITTVWPPQRTLDNQLIAPSIPAHIRKFPGGGPMALRKMPNSVSQNNANYIIRVLRTYPQKMLRRETFPPFIHQHWPKDPNGFILDTAEPIANCMTIAQIFSSRTPENTAFVWRTIRAEQQRLVDEMDRFSLKESLAALQASIVYLIMRVVDGTGSHHIELDDQMVLQSQEICKRFGQLYDRQKWQLEHSNRIPSWEDWVFNESRHRVQCLWFLTSRVVSVKAIIDCYALELYADLTLPSPKVLWEASTDPLWQFEYELDSLEKQPRLSTVGELVDAHRRPNNLSDALLDTWNAGVDDLGFLLNLAIEIS
ncbi:hypothetical protein F5884DRAFT_779666 [Xylogone sp. PMI_703]|nr:hypothetical protein F5884DRAFT_779666 [Xylogone sp. PMI_703]